MNHFVTPPSVDQAAVANDGSFLADRLTQYQRSRGVLPNLVAVDFYALGDTVAVVDRLNHLGHP